MSSFTAMFFLGVGSAIIGAASRNIGLSPYQIGLLLATQNIGFILSVITVGTLADSTDKARLMFAAFPTRASDILSGRACSFPDNWGRRIHAGAII